MIRVHPVRFVGTTYYCSILFDGWFGFETQVLLKRALMVYDDLDLAREGVRLRAKGGHGGHTGMPHARRSIARHFSGSRESPWLCIGAQGPSEMGTQQQGHSSGPQGTR